MTHHVVSHPNKYKEYAWPDYLPLWAYAGKLAVPNGGTPRVVHMLGMTEPVVVDEEEKVLLFGSLAK